MILKGSACFERILCSGSAGWNPHLSGLFFSLYRFWYVIGHNGYSYFLYFLISITNLTSAGQMAGAGLLASKAALIEIALTTLIINARYFLMSLSLSQKVNPKMKLWQRMLVSYGITDEIFAVEIGQSGLLSFSYMSGLIVCSAFGWFTGTLIGASAGSLLPAGIGAALNIALYAMFIAIVTPASLASKPVLFCSISSAVLSILFRSCLDLRKYLQDI